METHKPGSVNPEDRNATALLSATKIKMAKKMPLVPALTAKEFSKFEASPVYIVS